MGSACGLDPMPRSGRGGSRQTLQTCSPHETVTAWVCARLIKTAKVLRRPWEETPEAFAQRLQAVVADVNQNCKVHDACAGFPGRLLELIRRKGDRLHT